MKKVKVIYNPSSGTHTIQRRLDTICNILLDNGYILSKYATKRKNDAMEETIRTCNSDWDIIVACGGDGTINEIANGIVKGGRKIPVAILAAGTVNDFANSLSLPRDAKEFCKMIMEGKTIDVDLGRLNDKYFVNVAAGGLLTNIAHQVHTDAKTVLGRLAYYLEGVKEIPKQMFNAFKAEIEVEEFSTIEDEIVLFLVSNSSYIGGFKRIAPRADIMDGQLDVIIIKKSEIQDIITIFIDLIKGEHINHPKVEYFKTKRVSIKASKPVDLDIDGEYGGELPATLEVVPGGFRIFICN